MILAIGISCLDYIVYLNSFPKPDTKVRAENTIVQGGGNCGNVCCNIATLFNKPNIIKIVTKLGNDVIGKQIVQSLKDANVDTSAIIQVDMISPFTYIIVDQQNDTRTCIHSPSKYILEPTDIHPEKLLQNVNFVYLDGRFEIASAELVKLARKKNIPVLLDYEKFRNEEFEKTFFLHHIDYLITPEEMPRNFTKIENTLESMALILQQYKQLTFIITTLAENGCVLMKCKENQNNNKSLKEQNSFTHLKELKEKRELHVTSFIYKNEFQVYHCTAKRVNVIDSTGAGDAFISSIIYGILHKLDIPTMLRFACFIAANKCLYEGARNIKHEWIDHFFSLIDSS